MKYPGQQKPPPKWWREREISQSPIEEKFSKALGDFADKIESEKWFGDKEKHSRYRVDFILKDVRLIVELDGHEFHSTKEQRTKDAIRERYLTRAGYSVIRFTGSEVYSNPDRCVEEVRELYKERLQLRPVKYRVMYVDYKFLTQQLYEWYNFFKDMHPNRSLKIPQIEEVLFSCIEWLHEKCFITIFIFVEPDSAGEVNKLNSSIFSKKNAEIRINIISEDLYIYEMGNHFEALAHLFDDFFVVADDLGYVPPLEEIVTATNCKLLRKDNDNTRMIGDRLSKCRWQNIAYVIGGSLGLDISEM